ncbi:hypothetical protein D3C78_1931220 [compost metagenome]
MDSAIIAPTDDSASIKECRRTAPQMPIMPPNNAAITVDTAISDKVAPMCEPMVASTPMPSR